MKLGLKELQQVRDEALKMGRNHQSKQRASLARASFDLSYAADVVIAMTVVGAAAEAKNGTTSGTEKAIVSTEQTQG